MASVTPAWPGLDSLLLERAGGGAAGAAAEHPTSDPVLADRVRELLSQLSAAAGGGPAPDALPEPGGPLVRRESPDVIRYNPQAAIQAGRQATAVALALEMGRGAVRPGEAPSGEMSLSQARARAGFLLHQLGWTGAELLAGYRALVGAGAADFERGLADFVSGWRAAESGRALGEVGPPG